MNGASQGPSPGMGATPRPGAVPVPGPLGGVGELATSASGGVGHREAGQLGLASSPFSTRSPASHSKLSRGPSPRSPGTESPSAELRSDSIPGADRT